MESATGLHPNAGNKQNRYEKCTRNDDFGDGGHSLH